MAAPRNSAATATAHAAHHGPNTGDAHGSVREYVTGFILSVILTIIPFGLVMSGALSAGTVIPICVILGLVQIVVHLVYFLHMNATSARSWNMAAFLFTLIVLVIVVAGSLWVMYHLNNNMMPGAMPVE